MAKKGQKFKKIDEGLIFKIVKEKIDGKTYLYLSKKYEISQGTIMTWVKRYRDRGYVNRNKQGVSKKTQNMTI